MDHYRLVYESPGSYYMSTKCAYLNACDPEVYSYVPINNVYPSYSDYAEAWGWYNRSITPYPASNDGTMAQFIYDSRPPVKFVKTYEVVKGATLHGTAPAKADIFKLENNQKNKTLPYSENVSIIVGSDDHCNEKWGVDYLKTKMEENFANAKLQFYVVPNANHMFKNHEKELSRYIVESYLKMK
jgi:hypothetical protein